MGTEWWIVVGGGSMGIGGLYLRDYFVSRRRRGLSLFPLWAKFLFLVPTLLLIFFFAVSTFASLFTCTKCHPRRVSGSASNLSQIHKALIIYADDNCGKFPSGFGSPAEDLFQLYPSIVVDPKVYLNPNEKKAAPSTAVMVSGKVAPEWLDAVGYTYLEGVDPANEIGIIAFERLPSSEGRGVVLVNGCVEFMNETEFQKTLKAQLAQEASRP